VILWVAAIAKKQNKKPKASEKPLMVPLFPDFYTNFVCTEKIL
jgi:hypothetical protein